jgi:hypothetical protein
MIEIQLQNLELVRKALKAVPGGAEWAISRTLNDVAISGRQAAIDDIFTRYYFATQGPIRKAMKITNASPHHLGAVIRVSGSRLPAEGFLATQTGQGVDIMEIRGQRSEIGHVFRAVMKYGLNVFTRLSQARGPVRMVTGMSIANMAREQKEVLPDIEAKINEQLSKRAAFWMGEALKPGYLAKYGGGHSE